MRPVRTKGGRRIGKTIRKLESSVEISSKESDAKEDEKRYRKKAIQRWQPEDSPVQSLVHGSSEKRNAE